MNTMFSYPRIFLKLLLIVALIALSNFNLQSQVLFQEDFNTSVNGATSGTSNGINWSSTCPTCLVNDYWEVNSGVFEGNDTNGEAIWQTDTPIDISNCSLFEIDFSIESVGSMEDCGSGCNSVDWVRLQYNIDGTGWVDPANSSFCSGLCAGLNVVASGDTPLTNYSTGCIPSTGNNLQIRISVQTWASAEYWRIDDINVSCGSANSGTNGNINLCSTSAPQDLFNQLGGTPDNNGTWTGPSTLTAGHLGTFDPTTMTAGTYTYTVGSGTCLTSSTVIVSLTPPGNAGNNAISNLCNNAPQLNLFDELGGTPDNSGSWSGPSNLTGGNLGIFNPATMMAGTYTYTVGSANCQVSSTVSVNITTSGNAGNNAVVDLCDNSPVLDLFSQLGGTPDNSGSWTGPSILTGGNPGTFDPSQMIAGTYTYTVGTGTCLATSTVLVNITPTGNAGNGGTANLCNNSAPINLFDQLGGTPDNTGSWTGVSTLTGGNLGSFDPSTMNAGTYTYTVGTATCSTNATVVVNVTSIGNAGNSSVIDICDDSPAIDLFNQLGGTPDNNGVWTGPSVLTGGNLGTFDPLNMTAGTYTFTVGTGACQTNSTVVVNINPTGNPGSNNNVDLCDNSSIINLFNELGGNPNNNGTWTGPSTVTGGNLGTFDPATMNAGIYTYNATTLAGCTYTDQVLVNIYNSPSPSFSADVEIGCEEHFVNFINTSNTNYTDYYWDFGDGNNSTAVDNSSNLYTTAGNYDVSLTVTDQNGCVGSLTLVNYIEVLPNPVADFTVDASTIPLGESMVNFTNLSKYASNFTWEFGDNSLSESTFDASHAYNATNGDSFIITLTAVNDLGCSDTAQFNLKVKEELIYYVPNAFTPNGDDFNNNFKPIFSSGFDPMNYQLLIYNRWGEIVFESRNSEIGWDGTYNNSLVEEGAYIWIVRFQGENNSSRQQIKGVVNLLR